MTLAPPFSPEAAIKLVADSIEQLRQFDVERLLRSFQPGARSIMARYVIENRPELADTVDDALTWLEEEDRTTGSQQPPHHETVETYTDLIEWLEHNGIPAANAALVIFAASQTVDVLYRDLESELFNTPGGNTCPARSGADAIEALSLVYEHFTPMEDSDSHALSLAD